MGTVAGAAGCLANATSDERVRPRTERIELQGVDQTLLDERIAYAAWRVSSGTSEIVEVDEDGILLEDTVPRDPLGAYWATLDLNRHWQGLPEEHRRRLCLLVSDHEEAVRLVRAVWQSMSTRRAP